MSHCEPGGVAVEMARPRVAGKISTVALIGPPNSGKSTLFNRLTGMRQKVANYPGVTVEQRSARMGGVNHRELTLIDLPGIYSLNSYSEDARVAVDVLQGNMPGTPAPDVVLLVLDALQLNRQLMLAAPVLAMGLPTLVLLNMSDLMTARGGEIDPLALARELGAPVAMISATKPNTIESRAIRCSLNSCTSIWAASLLTLSTIRLGFTSCTTPRTAAARDSGSETVRSTKTPPPREGI